MLIQLKHEIAKSSDYSPSIKFTSKSFKTEYDFTINQDELRENLSLT